LLALLDHPILHISRIRVKQSGSLHGQDFQNVKFRKPGVSAELVHKCPLFKTDSQHHDLNTGVSQSSCIQRRRQAWTV
jgi:hypothetical protein